MSIEVSNLRPLKAGEILDRAFRLYRANFWIFIGLTALFLLPFFVAELLLLVLVGFSENFIYLFFLFELFLIVTVLNGALAWLASQSYLGYRPSIWQAYWQAVRRFSALGLTCIFWVVSYSLVAVVIFVAVIIILWITLAIWVYLSSINQFMSSIIFLTIYIYLFLILLIPAVSYALWLMQWGVTTMVILVETPNITGFLDRDQDLMSKYFWHTFVVGVASALFSISIIFLPYIFSIYVISFFHNIYSFQQSFSFSVLVFQLGFIIGMPLYACIQTIFYYDLRVRREGYDLELALQ